MGAFAAATVNEIFVDASYWIALRADNQPQHKRAVELARQLVADRRRLVTSVLVFAEIHAFFSRKAKLKIQILHDFGARSINSVQFVTPADHEAAIALLGQFDDKDFSYCDAASFAMMRRMEIQQALSFDDHFKQVGWFEIIC